MATTTIRERAQAVIAKSLTVELDQVVPDASIQDDLGADSLDVVDLVMALEDEFDIEIPDEEQKGLTSVGQLCSYIEGKIGTT